MFILVFSCFVLGTAPVALVCLFVWISLFVAVALGSKGQLLLLLMGDDGQAE